MELPPSWGEYSLSHRDGIHPAGEEDDPRGRSQDPVVILLLAPHHRWERSLEIWSKIVLFVLLKW